MNKIHEMIHRLHNPDLGILFIRLALGVVFLYASWFKLTNMEIVLQGFASMGLAAWLAYLVAYCELLGGIAMILGIFVRYAGIVLAIIMLVAIKFLFANGFSLAGGGYEYNYVLALCAAAMVTFGAGRYSLAYWLKK